MYKRPVVLNAILAVIGTIVGIGLCEMFARAFLDPPPGYSLYSRDKNVAHASLLKMASDPRLLMRISPQTPGHDERGFRNRRNVESADIVAIGDSQTWGVNVAQDETWPAVLSTMGRMKVYSMALGGWGPIQYRLLAEDAVTLKPAAILVGFYFGNDVFDSCSHVYGTESYPSYRQEGVKYDAALAALRAQLEVADGHARVDEAHDRLAEMSRLARVWQGLARRSLIAQILMTRGLLPAVPSVDDLYAIADTSWADRHPEVAAVYRNGNQSTVLTFGYRGVALDLENACIRDGVRITKEVFTSLEALGKRAGIRIGIVFIPTKEQVYAQADASLQSRLDRSFANLISNENAIKAQLAGHCQVLEMVCVDATDEMASAMKRGAVLYRRDSDGHPVADGYRHIAIAARHALEKMGELQSTQKAGGIS